MMVGSVGTHNALGLALAKKAKFLLASINECYGDPEISPQLEEHWVHMYPIRPRGVYDEAKRISEVLITAYHCDLGVDTHITKIVNTYACALPNFVLQPLGDKPVTIYQTESTLTASALSSI